MRILVTGGSGFIGSLLCETFSSRSEVTGTYHRHMPGEGAARWEKADLLDTAALERLVDRVTPDVVIHCAGIKRGGLIGGDENLCTRVNGVATESLGALAGRANPGVFFIYLSSVSVYGAGKRLEPPDEKAPCHPCGVNGISKLYGEKKLRFLVEGGHLRHVMILRLAPCYDRQWTRNLERRAMVPGGLSYVRWGSGNQRMSALARGNVADWVGFVLSNRERFEGFGVYNLCDERPYSFNEIIGAFKASGRRPPFPDLRVPRKWLSRFRNVLDGPAAGKGELLRSHAGKICDDSIYDNGRMLATGFRPRHDLESVLL